MIDSVERPHVRVENATGVCFLRPKRAIERWTIVDVDDPRRGLVVDEMHVRQMGDSENASTMRASRR